MVEDAKTERHVNPFKDYQKRRNGKVGQRFHATFADIDTGNITYDSEVMLCGWADTERGKTVKLWLDEEADRHPFCGYHKRSSTGTGSFFIGLFVLIDCDGKPIDEKQEERAQGGGRRLSSQIHLMITSDLFVRFMTERSKKTATLTKQGLAWDSLHKGEMMTKAYIKSFLKIESLADLDRDESKAKQFHEVFRKPFSNWSGKHAGS